MKLGLLTILVVAVGCTSPPPPRAVVDWTYCDLLKRHECNPTNECVRVLEGDGVRCIPISKEDAVP